jgi:hypothetical protein
VSVTAPTTSSFGSDPADRRSAWYAASHRRLGLTEAAWWDPAVEHVIQALDRDEAIEDAAAELGAARGLAGFDLRETVLDLDALAEVLPRPEVDHLGGLGTISALTAWADAFIDRAHPPACVDALTGLVTPAYLRVRLGEVHRDCADRGVLPTLSYALVIIGPGSAPPTPLARLTHRLKAARCVRNWFPGAETACHLDADRLAILAPVDDRLGPRARGLAEDLAMDGEPARSHIEPLADRLADSHRRLDALLTVEARER